MGCRGSQGRQCIQPSILRRSGPGVAPGRLGGLCRWGAGSPRRRLAGPTRLGRPGCCGGRFRAVRSSARPSRTANTAHWSPRRNSAPVGTCSTSSCSQITIRASTRKASPNSRRFSGGSSRSRMTFTRCSSTPSAEIFGKAGRLDPPHRGRQRSFAAPLLQERLVAGLDLHGVARTARRLRLPGPRGRPLPATGRRAGRPSRSPETAAAPGR